MTEESLQAKNNSLLFWIIGIIVALAILGSIVSFFIFGARQTMPGQQNNIINGSTKLSTVIEQCFANCNQMPISVRDNCNKACQQAKDQSNITAENDYTYDELRQIAMDNCMTGCKTSTIEATYQTTCLEFCTNRTKA